MNETAKRLRLLRKEQGMSVFQLSICIGVSDTTICRWENGKSSIKREEIIKLARFFHVSADYLLGLEE